MLLLATTVTIHIHSFIHSCISSSVFLSWLDVVKMSFVVYQTTDNAELLHRCAACYLTVNLNMSNRLHAKMNWWTIQPFKEGGLPEQVSACVLGDLLLSYYYFCSKLQRRSLALTPFSWTQCRHRAAGICCWHRARISTLYSCSDFKCIKQFKICRELCKACD